MSSRHASRRTDENPRLPSQEVPVSESDALNPYQPPSMSEEPERWWHRLGKMFRNTGSISPSRFAKGHAIICSGIAFFVDPFEPTVLYAASPSADLSAKRMQLIAKEALQCLQHFVTEYPELTSLVAGRHLRVRMIREYSDSQADFTREVHFDQSTVSQSIEELSNGGLHVDQP